MSSDGQSALKVWHLAELYPPGYGGGAAAYVQEVCRYLAERGHEVRVLCTEVRDDEPYSVKTDFDGSIRIDRVNVPFRRQDPGGWHLSVREWREHKRKVSQIAEAMLGHWQPDIVNFHTPYPLLEEMLPNLTARHLPIVGMLHCSWTICPRNNSIQSPTGTACSGPAPARCFQCLYSTYSDGSRSRSLAKMPWRAARLGSVPAYRLRERGITRRTVDALFGYSKFISDHHQGYVKRVEFIPLGVDLSGLPTERPHRPRKPVRFVFNGGFQEHKGIWDVLDAAQTLKKQGLDFELHVWGPRQDAAELKKRDIEDRVFLRGLFTANERWRVYAEADVLLMATRVVETAPRVLQEAAAMGVPSIAPDQGGITEVIRHETDGMLFKFLDRADLERQMARVLERPEMISELAANLWRVVDIREAVGGIEDFYRRIIRVKNAERAALPAISAR